MANSPFGKLNLDRTKIKDYIVEFCEQEFCKFNLSDINSVNSIQHRCSIDADGKKLMIDFYFNTDGTTTIQPTVGKEKDIQVKLASHILSKIAPRLACPNANYSLKLENSSADLVIEYLQNLEGVEQLEKVISPDGVYELYKFQGPTGDKIVLKYFTNGTFQVQGKPLYLYQEVTCLLSEHLPFEQVVHNQEQAYCIKLDHDELKQEIVCLLPKAHVVIDPILQNVLVSSLAFKKIDINLLDYSPFITPALRVLDGYIKRLLYDNGKVINGTFNCFGKDPGSGFYQLDNNITTCANTKKAIEEAYNYYSKERHGYMHAGGVPEAHVVIENSAVANQKIMEILSVIEHTYSYIVP